MPIGTIAYRASCHSAEALTHVNVDGRKPRLHSFISSRCDSIPDSLARSLIQGLIPLRHPTAEKRKQELEGRVS